MRLAHFSDFHLGARSVAVQKRRMRALVDHALDARAEHLMFSGDLVDHGNVEDATALVEHLRVRGMYRADRFSLVPGNHDVWPLSSHGDRAALIAKWIGTYTAAHLAGRKMPGQERYEALCELFAPAWRGAARMYGDDPFPCVKRVGPIAIAMLDSTADTIFEHARGRFDAHEGEWLADKLASAGGTPLLLVHHSPFRWEVADADEVLERIPRPLRMALGALPRFDELVASMCDVSYGALPAVQAFIRRAPIAAVFCGHLHLTDGGARDSDFSRTLGTKPVYCMGRSGAIDQGRKRVYAYHVVDVANENLSVKTTYVPESMLD